MSAQQGKLKITKSEYTELYHMLERAGAFPMPNDTDHTITLRVYGAGSSAAVVVFSFDDTGCLAAVEVL